MKFQNPYKASVPLDWIKDALPPELGIIQKIEIVKQRPWSQVYRIRTEKRMLYFKICGMGRQHEAKLLQWLIREHATIMPDVIALDAGKGWILTADGGIPLRELSQAEDCSDLPSEGLSPEERPRPWLCHADRLRDRTAALLSEYAKLQKYSLAHTNTLLKMQLPDHRLHRLPELTKNLLITGTSKDWFDQTLSDQVVDTLPVMKRICQNLSDTDYSAALEHGDLHTGNILVKADQPKIFDWGDAWVTHPFCSLFPLLQESFSSKRTLVFTPSTEKLIDAYLTPWKQFAPIDALRPQFIAALHIGIILRSLNIANALLQTDELTTRRWSPHIAEYLTRWVQWSPRIRRNKFLGTNS